MASPDEAMAEMGLGRNLLRRFFSALFERLSRRPGNPTRTGWRIRADG